MSTEMVAVTVPRIPRIGELAPDFESHSTQGVLRLSDYISKGKWVVLFSYPGDFLPVCTTEFVEFARRNDEFEKRKMQLMGCSVDSVFSHIAWIRNIEETSGIKILFQSLRTPTGKLLACLECCTMRPATRQQYVRFSLSTSRRRFGPCSTIQQLADAISTRFCGLWTLYRWATRIMSPLLPTGVLAMRWSCLRPPHKRTLRSVSQAGTASKSPIGI